MKLENEENLSIKNSLLKVEENYLDIRNLYKKLASISSSGKSETVDLLYFNASNDASINLGLTLGMQNNVWQNLDCSGYKFLRIYYTAYEDRATNLGTNANVLLMNLDRTTENCSVAENKIGFFVGYATYYYFDIICSYNHVTKQFRPIFYFQDSNINNQDILRYIVYKIEGVK